MGMTQLQFANEIGVTPVSVARWEASRTPAIRYLSLFIRLSKERGAPCETFQNVLESLMNPVTQMRPDKLGNLESRIAKLEEEMADLNRHVFGFKDEDDY